MADEQGKESFDAIIAEQPIKTIDYRSIGSTGLRRSGGIINESTLRGLDGLRAMAVFKEMGDDASIGGVLYMMKAMIRSVQWPVRDASTNPQDLMAGDFIRSVFDDMEHPFSDVISEICSFIQYGFSLHELLFKRRAGRSPEVWLNSKYQDGRIGLRGIPIRSQDTIVEWQFDDAGSVVAAVQMDPYGRGRVVLPLSKCLHFRTSVFKNNPEGESFCRRAYVPWYFKKSIQQSQAIGIKRDLCGIPQFTLPGRLMRSTASKEEKAEYEHWKKIGTRMQNDEMAALFLPSDLIPDSKSDTPQYGFKLISSGGTRAHNLPQIITDLRTEIFDTAMAGMIQLGQGTNASGSFAMHSDKTELFLLGLTSHLDQICSVINLHLIPMLLDLNGIQVTDYPAVTHTPLERRNFKETVEGLATAQMAGARIFGGEEGDQVSRRIMEWAGMEPRTDEARTALERANMPISAASPNTRLVEIPYDRSSREPTLTEEELKRLSKPIISGEPTPQKTTKRAGRGRWRY